MSAVGSGTVVFGAGNTTIAGAYDVPAGTVIAGGTATFLADTELPSLTLSGECDPAVGSAQGEVGGTLPSTCSGTLTPDPQFDAKMRVVREQMEHHVEEEERELFPLVAQSCSREELEDMGTRMEQLAEELREEGQPRASIPGQTDQPAQI